MRKNMWIAFGLAVSATAMASPAEFDKAMQPVLDDYLKIQQALADDSTKGVADAAGAIARASAKLPAVDEGLRKELRSKMGPAAQEVAKAKTIEAAREAFKRLSAPMAAWADAARPAGISIVFCSMAGASWLQRKGEVANPYFGAQMRKCGEVAVAGKR